jgi:hypothetical protein
MFKRPSTPRTPRSARDFLATEDIIKIVTDSLVRDQEKLDRLTKIYMNTRAEMPFFALNPKVEKRQTHEKFTEIEHLHLRLHALNIMKILIDGMNSAPRKEKQLFTDKIHACFKIFTETEPVNRHAMLAALAIIADRPTSATENVEFKSAVQKIAQMDANYNPPINPREDVTNKFKARK